MTETELLRQDLQTCSREIAVVERRLYQLEAMRRRLEHDIAEAEREQEREYA